ncbi:MAG: DUF11 domain-containing protein [Thermoflexales bacterium]|nr:DUF11 domain-containing protein [Thermoflexales bacterium]
MIIHKMLLRLTLLLVLLATSLTPPLAQGAPLASGEPTRGQAPFAASMRSHVEDEAGPGEAAADASLTSGISPFASILYHALYPHAGLRYYGAEGRLKYDFVLRSGAEVEQIELDYASAQDLRVTQARQLEILASPASITLTASMTSTVSTTNTFTAFINPITTTTPVTYVWQATGQLPLTNTGDLSSTVVFSWTTPDTQVVTVTATNLAGAATATHTVAILSCTACVWGSVYYEGQAASGALVTLTLKNSLAQVTSMWSPDANPIYLFDAAELGAQQGDEILLTASYSGQAATKVCRVFPGETDKKQQVNLVLSPPGVGPAASAWPMVGRDWSNSSRTMSVGPKEPLLVAWQFQTISSTFNSRPAVGPGEVIYIGSSGGDDQLYALSRQGDVLWTYPISGGVSTSSPAVDANETVYVGGVDGFLYAINTADGSLRWRDNTSATISASPVIGPDGTIYIGAENGLFRAYYPDGSIKWQAIQAPIMQSSAGLAPDGSVYVGSTNRRVYAYDRNGVSKWNAYVGNTVRTGATVAEDGTIFVGTSSYGNMFYAINPEDGSIKCSHYYGNQVVDSTPAIGHDGTIYVGHSNGQLLAYDPRDCSLKWEAYSGPGLVLGATIVDRDGAIYHMSYYSHLYATEPVSGTRIWGALRLASYADRNSPSMGSDGTLYVPTRNALFAITPPPQVIHFTPPANAHIVHYTTTVSASYNQPISAATVSTRTFVIHAAQTGLLSPAYGVDGETVMLTPTLPFKPGELVQVIATTGPLSLNGQGPISPTVWQFWTKTTGGSGIFTDTGQQLGGSNSLDVALADLDGDSDLDAFVANTSGAPNKVWLNDGTGVFSDSAQSLGGSYSRGVAVGDLNGDGSLDAFVANGTSNGHRVWLNDGTGAFNDTGQSLGNSDSWDVALGDLDGDGDLDAVAANAMTQTNKIWLNDGTGFFTANGLTLGDSDARGVAVGDLDNDGDLDAFVANVSNQPNKVWFNNGSGVLSDSGQNLGNSSSEAVALGDLDGDGDLDAFVGNAGSVGAGIGQADVVWLNDGAGAFSLGQNVGSTKSRHIVLGDIDGDGDLDAFAATHWDGLADADRVWFNDGTGHFVDSGQRLGNTWSEAVAWGDIDSDGDLDAFVANGGQANTVWLNQFQACYARINDDPTNYSILQLAIDAAQEGDLVKVAGMCAGVQVRDGMTQTAYISKSISLRGGYTTTNWTMPDPIANPTTLEAQESGRVIYITGNITPVIDGLIIIGGNSNDGGGIYSVDAHPRIINTTITDNHASQYGGVYIQGDNAYLESVRIERNTVSGSYGGLFLSGSHAVISNVIVLSNTASYDSAGAQINSNYGRITLLKVIDNTSARYHGGLYFCGQYAVLDGLEIRGNSSAHSGTEGGGLRICLFDYSTLRNSLVLDNYTPRNGAVYVIPSHNYTVTNIIVANNRTSTGSVSGAVLAGNNVKILHATFANNDGGALATNGEGVELKNSIIASHTLGVEVNGGNLTAANNVLWNNSTPFTGTVVNTGNMVCDPRFMNTSVYDYHLTNISCAIDAGLDIGIASDFEGDFRPLGTGYDVGADEFDGVVPPLDVTIDGPATGVAHAPYVSTATVNLSVTLPVTYTWQATDQSAQSFVAGRSSVVTYTWNTPGPKLITVTASNAAGTVTDTHLVTLLPADVRKSVYPTGNIAPGGVLRYTIAYTNSGDVAMSGLTITDAVPPHTIFLQAQDGGSYDDSQVVWTVSTLQPGETIAAHLQVRVDKPLATGTAITNRAALAVGSAWPFDTNVVTNTVFPLPDFGLSVKSVTPQKALLAPNDLVTYTVTYTNGGSSPSSGTVISDPLPAGLEYVDACCSGGLVDGAVLWDLGSVGAQAGGVVSLTARVRESALPGVVMSNTAWIDDGLLDPTWTDPVSVTTIYPLLVVDKAVAPTGPVLPGVGLSYTIRITNTGNLTATSVQVLDSDPNGQDHAWSLGDLAPGAAATVSFSLQTGSTLVDSVVLTNTAVVSAANAALSTSDMVTTVVRRPALSLSKGVTPGGEVLPGTVLTYTLYYTNSASVPAAGALVTDWLPAGVISPTTWPPLGTIPPNSSGALSFTAQVAVPLADGTALANQAVLGADYAEPAPSNAVTNTVIAPAFELALAASQANTVTPADVLTYTLYYTNAGHAASQNSFLAAPLPAQASYLVGGSYITASHTVSLPVENVSMGASGTASFSVQIHRPLANGLQLTQSLTLYDYLAPAVNSNVITHTITSAPDFTISTKEVTPVGALTPGTILTYTIRYTNSGDMNASGVVISDTLPQGMAYAGGGLLQDNTLTWSLRNVPVDTGGIVSFTAVALDTHALLANQAEIACDQVGLAATNVVTTPVLAPILHVHKTVHPFGAVAPGSLLTYTLSYTNVGTLPAEGVFLVDALPPGTHYHSGGDITSTQAVTFSLGDVPVGASGTVTWTAQVAEPLTAGTIITNSARFFFDPVYPVGLYDTTPLNITGSSTWYPLGGSGGSYYYAQSFVATAPRLVDAAVFIYGQAAPYPELRLQLWGDNGGSPDPAQRIADGAIITGGVLTSGGQRYHLTPLYPLSLTVNARYWLVVDGSTDRTSAGSVGVQYNGANPYSDGVFRLSPDGNTWQTPNANWDLDINVMYLEPPATNAVTTTIVTAPELVLEKSVSPAGDVSPGTWLTYTLAYRNESNIPASNTIITDWLPAGTVFGSGGTYLPGEHAVQFELGNLAAMESGIISLVIAAPPTIGPAVNWVGVAANEVPTPVMALPVTTTIIAPVLILTKTVTPAGPAAPGAVLSYRLAYANAGNLAATGVIITDPLPLHTEYLAGGNYLAATGVVSFGLGFLAPGASGELSFTVQVDSDAPVGAVITNVAHIASDQAESIETLPTTNTVTAPVLEISKSVTPVGEVSPGAVLTYTIAYTNSGNQSAAGVIITDAVPALTTYLSGGVYLGGLNAVRFDIGTLNASASGAASFSVRVNTLLDDGVIITNVASIVCDQAVPVSSNTTTSTVRSAPDLRASSKAVAPAGDVGPGTLLTFTITARNTGNIDAAHVVITDILPAHTSHVSGGMYFSATRMISWAIDSLAVGASHQVSFTVRVDQDAPPGAVVTNVAYLLDQASSFVTPSTANRVVAPVLELAKRVTPKGVVAPGTVLTYTLIYTNSGNQAATNVVVTDALPAGASYLSGGAYLAGTVRFDIGSLGIGASGEVSFTVRVDTPLDDGTMITNVATVASDQTRPAPSNVVTNITSVPVVATSPLAFDVALSPSQATTRALTIGNVGSADLAWSLVEISEASWLYTSPTGGVVAASESAQVVMTFTAPFTAGAYTTLLRITSSDPNEPQVNIPVTLTVMGVYGVVIEPPAAALSGDPRQAITHTLRLTNTGNTPDTFMLARSGNNWTTDVSSPVGPLAAGAGTDVQVVVHIPVDAIGGASDVVTIQAASQGNPSSLASAALTTTANPIYGVMLDPSTAEGNNAPGGQVVYTLTVRNTGNVTDSFSLNAAGTWVTSIASDAVSLPPSGITSITVTVVVPTAASDGDHDAATITVASQSDPSVSDASILTTTAIVGCIPVGGVNLGFAPAVLKIGQVVTFTASVAQGTSPVTYTWDLGDGSMVSGSIVNHTYQVINTYRVVVTATNLCGSPITATQELVVTGPVFTPTYGVVLEPASAAASGHPGTTVTYTLRLTNTGNVEDAFILNYAGNDPAWAVNLLTTVYTLANGAGVDVIVRISISPAAADGVTDTVRVRATGTGVSDSSDLTTTAVEIVPPSPKLDDSSKMVEPLGDIAPGGLLTYTITVRNTGDMTATGVVITDTLPAHTSYVSGGNYDPGTRAVSWVAGSVAIGDLRQWRFIAQVDTGAPVDTVISNVAHISSDQTGPVETLPVTNMVSTLPSAPVLWPISNPNGDGDYQVTWNAVTKADSYTLQEDDNISFSSPAVRYTGAALQHLVSDQTAGTWYYRVKASNPLGDSPWSNSVSTVVVPPGLDTPVLNAIDNADRDGNYTLDWLAVSGALTYTLQEASTATFSNPSVRYAGPDLQYVISEQRGGTWHYRVKATNNSSYSAWSNPQSVVVTAYIYLPLVLRNWPPIPGVPTLNPINPNLTCGSYTVSWTEPAGPVAASYYVLQEDTHIDFSGAIQVYEGPQRVYAGSKLAIGRYYYRVRACNTWTCGGWSSTQYVDISAPGVPGLHLIDNSDGNGNYVVGWDVVDLASGYVLQEAVKTTLPVDSDFTQVYADVSNFYAVSGKGPTRYYYRVQAYNSCSQSAWSDPLQYADVRWEKEPNDDARTQANGPMVFGLVYYGAFPDQSDFDKDYFYFDLDVEHSVSMDLTNIPSGQDYDLALWDTAFKSPIAYSDNKGSLDEHIQTGILLPGRYYVQIYHYDSGGSMQPYRVYVVYR